MKIAMVVHDFDLNFGHGRYAVELARHLPRHHHLHIFANRFEVAQESHWTYHHVSAWRRSAIVTIGTFLVAVERQLRSQTFDLIHAQGLTCWQADVITGHMCNAAKFQRLRPIRWRDHCFPRLIIPLEKRFFQQARARHLIAISRQFAAEIRQHYGWQRPVSVVYHGTDTQLFHGPAEAGEKTRIRAGYGLPLDAWVWLFMGEAVKGLAQTLQQLAFFPGAILLIVTRSDLKPYRAMARQLGVETRVVFHGVELEPARAYQAADLFLYPSDYDPFGLVVAEAMATELPVIVGQNIGAAEWITPRQNGLCCDPNHAESIREQLAWLQSDPARARRLGQAARRTVQEHSWDACAAATEAVYEQVLAEKRRPP